MRKTTNTTQRMDKFEEQMTLVMAEQAEFKKMLTSLMTALNVPTETSSKKSTTSKKKSVSKTNAKAKAEVEVEVEAKPQTRAEAVDKWCAEKGITDEDRKAFGEAKKHERELRQKAYDATCKKFKDKVAYNVFMAEYNNQLKKVGLAK